MVFAFISGDVFATRDHWEDARQTCSRQVARLSKYAPDPNHSWIHSPLNRFMATHKRPFHELLQREGGQNVPDAEKLGTLVRVGEHPPELEFIPSAMLQEVLLMVQAAGGRVGWLVAAAFSVAGGCGCDGAGGALAGAAAGTS